MFLFSKLIYLFLDTLTLYAYVSVIKINNFRGDLSGISARKEALSANREPVDYLTTVALTRVGAKWQI